MPFFSSFLSPLGLFILAALDSSAIFFLPVAVDAAVVYLSSSRPQIVWLFPILATAGSLAGAMTTYALPST